MSDKKIKCVIFDLDNTLWDGTLSEGDEVKLKDGVRDMLDALDRRGILMSIASKNNFDDCEKKLREFEIFDYFLVPQISWNPKSEAVSEISTLLNLSTKEFAFVDDRENERDEVKFAHPDISIYDESVIPALLTFDEFSPRFITEDSALRRRLYQNDLKRQKDEKEFHGTSEEFLRTLNMKLTIKPVSVGDLERVEELTRRTHQLNSTGRSFSYEQLCALIHDPNYIFLIVSLENKYGDCGKIGLALVEKGEKALTIKLLIMSCRVMTLGIGSAILIYLMNMAEREKCDLYADFVFTDRNRVMYITYKMLGFEDESDDDAKETLLVWDKEKREVPDWFEICEV